MVDHARYQIESTVDFLHLQELPKDFVEHRFHNDVLTLVKCGCQIYELPSQLCEELNGKK